MSTQDAILGLDVGTTSAKAVLFDLSGTELATAERAYRLRTPQAGWAEQDPEELWQALVSVVRATFDQAGSPSRTLRVALALATQSGSLVPARSDGQPVHPIVTWLDGRSKELVKEWQAAGVEEQVKAISGWLLYPGLCLPTIAWLRRHRTDVFEAAERYLSVNDFLVHRLTGRFRTNPSNGSGMQLLDITTGQWSQELCALAGINASQLSPIQPSGVVIGEITSETSSMTGLPSGTVVVNGGHDQGCAALGLGVTAPGKVLLGCGTAWIITGVVDAPDVGAMPDGLNMHFHPAPGRWTVSQSLGGLGASLEWLLNQCWQGTDPHSPAGRADMFAMLDRELMDTAPGGGGLFFLPLAGGHASPVGEQRGSFLGLRLDHTRASMARSVMEGAAFELRWALVEIRRAGMPVERLWMTGGAARSSLWPEIVADVTGLPLSLPLYGNWPAIGAAILAGVGIGAFDTHEAAQARFREKSRPIEPNGARKRNYDEQFASYRQLVARSLQGTEKRNE